MSCDDEMSRSYSEAEEILNSTRPAVPLYPTQKELSLAAKTWTDAYTAEMTKQFPWYAEKLPVPHYSDAHECHRDMGYLGMLRLRFSVLLQDGLMSLVQNEPHEIKEWFLAEEMSVFGAHLSPPKPKPALKITPRTKIHSLPSDVVSLILSYLDLETCVVLRETCTQWYCDIQSAEIELKQKLLSRNPWFEPQGEINTWQDCVLVYLARLKKWPKNGDLCSLDGYIKGKTGIIAYHGENSEIVELLEPEKNPQPEIITSKSTETVVRFDDVIITLPGHLTQDDFREPVHIGSTLIAIRLEDGTAHVLSRDSPHYKKGFSCVQNGKIGSAGNVLFIGIYLVDFYGRRLVSSINGDGDRYFVDLYRRRPVSSIKGLELTASYNGILWWSLRGNLIPTFLDLENPQNQYYYPNKVVRLNTRNGFHQGTGSRDSSHLVQTDHSHNEDGVHVVNLVTGEITLIHGTRPTVGFVKGKFQARFIGEEPASSSDEESVETKEPVETEKPVETEVVKQTKQTRKQRLRVWLRGRSKYWK